MTIQIIVGREVDVDLAKPAAPLVGRLRLKEAEFLSQKSIISVCICLSRLELFANLCVLSVSR
jgi:hypothetical protein